MGTGNLGAHECAPRIEAEDGVLRKTYEEVKKHDRRDNASDLGS